MTPRHLLAGALAFSLAFQVAWSLAATPAPTGPTMWLTAALSVLAAMACTLIVPAGLHVWPMIPVRGPAWRAVRALVMCGVCAAAAVTTFMHSVAVLSVTGWTAPAAWAVVGGVELLVVLSTMALRPAQTHEQADDAREPDRADSPDLRPVDSSEQACPLAGEQPADSQSEPPRQVVPTDRPTGPRRLSAVPTDRVAELSDDFLAWAAEQSDRPSGYAVRQRFGCGRDVAARLLAKLDEPAVENVG